MLCRKSKWSKLKRPKPGALLTLRIQAHRLVMRRLGYSPWRIYGDRAAYGLAIYKRYKM